MTFANGVALTAARVVETASLLLNANPYGVLSTIAQDGGVHARLVQHLTTDFDLGVWIGTSPRSRKAAEIRLQSKVSYTVEDRSKFAYATLVGAASVVDDLDARRRHWQSGLAAFFPDGPAGDDFVLISAEPQRVEVMNFSSGLTPSPYGLTAAVAVRSDDGWTTAQIGQPPE